MFKQTALAAAVLLGTSVTAQAATWHFIYEINPLNVVTGSFEGDLQADMNTILLTGANNELALNGTPHSAIIDTVTSFGGGTAEATLDGSALNFGLTDGPLSANGFSVVSGLLARYFDTTNEVAIIEFVPGAWSVSEFVAPVPLPASLGLMLAGLAGLGFARRRRS